MKDKLHIAALIADKIQGKITPEQERNLDDWLNESQENQLLYQRAINPKHQLDQLEVYALFDKQKVKARLEEELFPTRKVSFNPRKLLQWAAAILLPLIIAGGVYFYVKAPAESQFAELNKIILPGSERAILVLSSGEEVLLEGDQAEKSIAEGKTTIKNENKILDYFSKKSEDKVNELRYNELKTPLGGNYQLQLADGTKVWLNAGSSIRFPVAFAEESRDVYLQGEGYFEVTKTGSRFVVHTTGMDVQVLGTSFNVSAYMDDEVYKTTLVEGSVKVINSAPEQENEGLLLVPNEQAIYTMSSSEWKKNQVNTTYYTSWIKGKIEFNNEDLEEVMKRLSRWYNFEYTFKNEAAKNFHFTGRLDKTENISSILEMLELTTSVRFNYKNGKVNIQ